MLFGGKEMFEQASWIGVSEDYGEICPTFFKEIKTESQLKRECKILQKKREKT